MLIFNLKICMCSKNMSQRDALIFGPCLMGPCNVETVIHILPIESLMCTLIVLSHCHYVQWVMFSVDIRLA